MFLLQCKLLSRGSRTLVLMQICWICCKLCTVSPNSRLTDHMDLFRAALSSGYCCHLTVRRFQVSTLPGAFKCSPLCLRGFSPGSPFSSHSPNNMHVRLITDSILTLVHECVFVDMHLYVSTLIDLWTIGRRADSLITARLNEWTTELRKKYEQAFLL